MKYTTAATQIDRVNKYYDSTVIDYKTVWTGSKDLAMHFGYYDDGIKSHKDSLLKMNEVLAKLANISKNDRVMDAGCGYEGRRLCLYVFSKRFIHSYLGVGKYRACRK